MPTLTVLVGLPGSGKSTSVPEDFDGFVYSTDNFIERQAKAHGQTYDIAFKGSIDLATKTMNTLLSNAIKIEDDVLWDQTNMSSKKRLGILSKFPKTYRKICICRVPPQDASEWAELDRRILTRATHTGKMIPHHIIESMADSYVEPTLDEGFDEVHLYDIFGNEIK